MSALGLAGPGSGMVLAQPAKIGLPDSLNREVMRLHVAGRYQQGIVAGKLAVSQLEKLVGKHDPRYVTALNNLAAHYQSAAHLDEASKFYHAALAISKTLRNEQPDRYATSLNNVGYLLVELGDYAGAEPYFQQALAVTREHPGPQRSRYAAALSNLGGLYYQMNRYADAEQLYQQALDIDAQVTLPQYVGHAYSLNNLAALYEVMGRYDRAEAYYLDAIHIWEQLNDPQQLGYAAALHSMASIYADTQRPVAAESLYLRALAIREHVLGLQHPSCAATLNGLAELYVKTKHFSEAEAYAREALGIREKVYGRRHPAYTSSLNSLALLFIQMNRYDQADTLLRRVLAIDGQRQGVLHNDYAALSNLASLYSATGRYAEAEDAGARAASQVMQYLREAFVGLSEQEKQQFVVTFDATGDSYHSILAHLSSASPHAASTARAYDYLLFTKGVLLATTSSLQRQLYASSDTALRRRFDHWQALRHQLVTAQALPPAQQQARGLDPAQLGQRANKLEKELAAHSTAFRQSTNLPTATWQQVQRTLRPGEAAIELVRYNWFHHTWTDSIFYSAYVLTPGDESPRLVVLRNGNDLEGRYLAAYCRLTHTAGKVRGPIDANVAANTALADPQLLYRAYWQPIAQALPPGIKTVYLSADGVYQQLNLHTLQNPATGRYLLDELDLHLLGSTRELVASPNPTRMPAGKEVVLVGNPVYRLTGPPLATLAPSGQRTPYSRSENLLSAGEVPPLPGTALEIKQLDSLLTANRLPHRVYTGPAATEEAVRDLHRPRVLHIATHGFFVLRTQAVPSPASQELSNAQLAAATDPMLRSGLLLAGVSSFRDAAEKPATEDGILTAYEAALLDLQGTELVVLSACETGLGQVQYGEGVYGLQRGFTVAGAKSILMSLWKVDDAVTQDLMKAFYHYWLGGQSKRAALLAAQQQVRHRHPAPYYWGAFVLVGE